MCGDWERCGYDCCWGWLKRNPWLQLGYGEGGWDEEDVAEPRSLEGKLDMKILLRIFLKGKKLGFGSHSLAFYLHEDAPVLCLNTCPHRLTYACGVFNLPNSPPPFHLFGGNPFNMLKPILIPNLVVTISILENKPL